MIENNEERLERKLPLTFWNSIAYFALISYLIYLLYTAIIVLSLYIISSPHFILLVIISPPFIVFTQITWIATYYYKFKPRFYGEETKSVARLFSAGGGRSNTSDYIFIMPSSILPCNKTSLQSYRHSNSCEKEEIMEIVNFLEKFNNHNFPIRGYRSYIFLIEAMILKSRLVLLRGELTKAEAILDQAILFSEEKSLLASLASVRLLCYFLSLIAPFHVYSAADCKYL